eukprot:2363071-Prymnesium_polylepis.3
MRRNGQQPSIITPAMGPENAQGVSVSRDSGLVLAWEEDASCCASHWPSRAGGVDHRKAVRTSYSSGRSR